MYVLYFLMEQNESSADANSGETTGDYREHLPLIFLRDLFGNLFEFKNKMIEEV